MFYLLAAIIFASEVLHICWTLCKVILSAWTHCNAFMNNYRYWRTNCIFFITNDIIVACPCSCIALVEWEGCLCQRLWRPTELEFRVYFASLLWCFSALVGRTAQRYREHMLRIQKSFGLNLHWSSQFLKTNKLKTPRIANISGKAICSGKLALVEMQAVHAGKSTDSVTVQCIM